MSIILIGKAFDVFLKYRQMLEAMENGCPVFYDGYRSGDGPNVIRTEITGKKMGTLLVSQVESAELSILPSLKFFCHWPSGFDWGCENNGTAQLALALLLDATGDPVLALKHHRDFERCFVAGWGDTWSINAQEIDTWVKLKDRTEKIREANHARGD